MSKVAELTTLIAGRELEIHNLHVKHKGSAVVGYSFDLYFEGGEINSYATGSITGYELDEITEWLWENV